MPRPVLVAMLAASATGTAGCSGGEDALDAVLWWFRTAKQSAVAAGDTRTAAHAVSTTAPPLATDDTVRIAAFNIQVFGRAKAGKPDVMRRLADIVRRFDVVAVQEIRSSDPAPFRQLVDLVNASGRNYGATVGPRLGRTSSKEQYAFVYDADRIELAKKTRYTLQDYRDRLHREPYVARFRVRTDPPAAGFTFTLVNIHTDPDEVREELAALDDALIAIARDGTKEDDLILLGDLNAAPRDFGDLAKLPGVRWAIEGVPTNTRRSKTYDNLLFDGRGTAEFTGRAGVFDFAREFGLAERDALAISDHFPVWAEFTAAERRDPTVAAGPAFGRYR
ncbi:MAG: endonuclease/exonuclease/phosphatase family protein [Planctomycetota bacterium]